MAKSDPIQPWQHIEEQAFHAYREWPLWLVLRQRELAAQRTHHTPNTRTTSYPPSATQAGSAAQQPTRHSTVD